MRPPRTLVAIGFGLAALMVAPAQAAETEPPQTVDITVDLEASAEDILESIREQAWTACKPELGSRFIEARANVRRACTRQMVSDVVYALERPEVLQLAQARGICLKG